MNITKFGTLKLAFKCSSVCANQNLSQIKSPTYYYVDNIYCAATRTKNPPAMSSDVFSDNSWRGVPLTELYGSQSPWGAPEFPLVSPGYSHTVLYHVPSGGLMADRPPKPQIGHDKWDSEHVRLPCSSQSLYPVEDRNGEKHLKKRWEIIENALWKPIRNSQELADAILSYNTKFKTMWKFRALHKLFNEYLEEEESQYFFDVTLPEIAKLALALPKLIQAPIPLLKQHKNHSVSLSQQQIASLLANAFFCTFPRRNTTKKTSEYASYPFINFNRLYESSGSDHILEKLKCICHYFRRVTTKAGVGAVTFARRSVPPRRLPAWPRSAVALASLPLHVDPDNTIEDAEGLIQVDFANKFLGGGVLNHGCVQEEIRFVICPELMISMLFTEVLRPNEALMIIGCEQYSKYSGYGHTFQWSGDHRDATPLDSSQRRRCAVLAIDALPFDNVAQEYRKEAIIRELNKAWVGFSFDTDPSPSARHHPGVATGNWGCGAFGGSPQLKCLVQMMACAQAQRPMAYYTFKDNGIRDDVIAVYNLLARYNVTVGELYKYILRFSQTDVRYSQLHAFLHQVLRDEGATGGGARVGAKGSGPPGDGPEKMDISTTSDISIHDLSTPIQKEFSTSMHNASTADQTDITTNSPDLFSQEDDTLVEIKVQIDQATTSKDDACNSKRERETTNQPTSKKTKSVCETTDSPCKIDTSGSETANRSRLFEEMQKLDEQSGRLNLSVPNTSPFKQTHNASLSDMNRSVDVSQTDPTTELKKKVSKKITDYFSKRSI